jgi:predicted DNA-binding protein (UPF0251 family)
VGKKASKVDYSEINQTEAAHYMDMTRMGLIQLEKRAMKKFKQELLKRNINFKDLLK